MIYWIYCQEGIWISESNKLLNSNVLCRKVKSKCVGESACALFPKREKKVLDHAYYTFCQIDIESCISEPIEEFVYLLSVFVVISWTE